MRIGPRLLTVSLCLLASGCAAGRLYLEETPVFISELHFDPSAEQGKVEFIEIANYSAASVNLSGWQVTGAGRVVLPAGTELRPGESLVLAQDADAFRETFAGSVLPVAILPGKLKNSGEVVRVEDTEGRVADEVEYDPSMPEVEKARGTGHSLHRLDETDAVAPAGAIWRAAAPTPGVLRSR